MYLIDLYDLFTSSKSVFKEHCFNCLEEFASFVEAVLIETILLSPTSTIIYTARGRETKPQRTTSSIAPKVAVLFSLKDGYLTLFTKGNLCNIWKRNYLVKKKKRYWKSLRIWRPSLPCRPCPRFPQQCLLLKKKKRSQLKEAMDVLRTDYDGHPIRQAVDFEVGSRVIGMNNRNKLPRVIDTAATLVEGSQFQSLGSQPTVLSHPSTASQLDAIVQQLTQLKQQQQQMNQFQQQHIIIKLTQAFRRY